MDKEIRSGIHKKLQRRLVEDDGEFEHPPKNMWFGMVVDCLKKNRSWVEKRLLWWLKGAGDSVHLEGGFRV